MIQMKDSDESVYMEFDERPKIASIYHGTGFLMDKESKCGRIVEVIDPKPGT